MRCRTTCIGRSRPAMNNQASPLEHEEREGDCEEEGMGEIIHHCASKLSALRPGFSYAPTLPCSPQCWPCNHLSGLYLALNFDMCGGRRRQSSLISLQVTCEGSCIMCSSVDATLICLFFDNIHHVHDMIHACWMQAMRYEIHAFVSNLSLHNPVLKNGTMCAAKRNPVSPEEAEASRAKMLVCRA